MGPAQTPEGWAQPLKPIRTDDPIHDGEWGEGLTLENWRETVKGLGARIRGAPPAIKNGNPAVVTRGGECKRCALGGFSSYKRLQRSECVH